MKTFMVISFRVFTYGDEMATHTVTPSMATLDLNRGGGPSLAAMESTLTIGGDLSVRRLGFGAMRLDSSDPAARPDALAVLRRAVEPAGAKVSVKCVGGKRKGCPFKSKAARVKAGKANVLALFGWVCRKGKAPKRTISVL